MASFLKSLTKSNYSFLNNKSFLYLIAVIAFMHVIYFVMNKEYSTLLFFFLVATIVYQNNKNMIIVLGYSLISVAILYFLTDLFNSLNTPNLMEGMASKKILKEKVNIKDENKDEDEDEDEYENNIDNLSVADIARGTKENFKGKKEGLKSKKSGFNNQIKLKPGLYNIPNKEQLKKQLGEADKMEEAYDELEKVVGENGINSMSKSTKDLVNQQKELLKGLKEITPALSEAMGAIGKIDMSNLSKMFNSIKPSE
jgi:hypothetical protein